MLVRILRQNVRLGMYIERFEGDWTDHPFWTTGFVLTKPSDLDKLHRSSVSVVIVDDSKGVGASASDEPAPAVVSKPANASGLARLTPAHAQLLQTTQACRQAVREIFTAARSDLSIDSERSAVVVDTIARSVKDNPSAMISLTRLKTMETYTFMHSMSVSALLVRFGRHLTLDEAAIQELGMAGLLHDIGKTRIDDAILTKTSQLTEDEIALIRSHPRFGAEILSRTDGLSPIILDVCLHHHERIDGSGYPDGLAGEALSFETRVTAICDVFDALTTARPYKLAWSTERALSSMANWTGHFDPTLLQEFAASLGQHKLTSPVRRGRAGARSNGTAVNGYSDPSG